MAEYQPANKIELELVEELAMYKWSEIRLWAMQIAAHSGEVLGQAEELPELPRRSMAYRGYVAFRKLHPDRPCLELMHRYERSYAKQHRRARAELLALKKLGSKNPIAERTQGTPNDAK